jgi:hypothetical protein
VEGGFCVKKVHDSRKGAGHTANPELKEWHIGMEERWLQLARSYELIESDSEFRDDIRPQLGRKQFPQLAGHHRPYAARDAARADVCRAGA